MMPRHANLRRLRLPVPLHRRRRRALVPQPRRAPGAGGSRGHLLDPAPVGQGPEARPRRAHRGRGGRPAHGAVHATPGAAACCRRSCSDWACSCICCAAARRYEVVHTCAFPYFSLLAAALVRPLRALSARERLVRGLERLLLARLPGRPRRAHRRARAAAVRTGATAGALLLRAPRAAPARGGHPWARAGAARAVRRADRPGARPRGRPRSSCSRAA